ncbi:AEC family transporter [Polyangium jinanense]|uniref:AEC family transporter n=1 Tax=Polyangium jinanense TaxID=2829994 RepID=A0A9X4ATH8_9BACT|nr:AEC family transporter [Polyangium jinanense]MDC3954334.1 AEC family transporter [Polyangium jinanense]MDC3984214.1 AEC family transporter [Polyangium jinanense]
MRKGLARGAMTQALGPLLGGLSLVLALGFVLARVRGLGAREADVLNGLVVDVTMPALLFAVLARDGMAWGAARVLPWSAIALLASLGVGAAVARGFGLDARAIGSAGIVASFSNTGFLGLPLLLTLFPGDADASSAAMMIDLVITTILLWTLGQAYAERFGRGASFDAKAALRIFKKPLVLAVPLGALVHALHLPIPPFLLTTLEGLGRTTTYLVFLSLGLSLDVRALSGRVAPAIAICAVKLLFAPAVALLCVRVFSVSEPLATVAVLQSAMPSALASVIIVALTGCDRPLAAAVCTLASLASMATLPLVAWIIDATRP